MRKLILLLVPGIFIFSMSLSAQDLDARSPKPGNSSVQQKKADAKKAKLKKKQEKGVEKGKKRHLKIQKRNARKMMKKSKRKSKKWNDKSEFVIFKNEVEI